MMRWAVGVYRAMLSFYPAPFRDEFGDEMRAVFAARVDEVTREGLVRTWMLFFREIRDWPITVWQAHRSERRDKRMTTLPVGQKEISTTCSERAGTWREVILGGLPHFLMGSLIAANKFLSVVESYPKSRDVSLVYGICLGMLVIAILFLAWRRDWPNWSASWYGYPTFIVMVLMFYGVIGFKLPESWHYTNTLFLGWLALWGIGYLYLFFKDRIKALLAIFFLLPLLGVEMLEFIPNPIEGWLALGIGLMDALVAGIIIRRGNYRLASRLVVGVNLVAALILAYTGEYLIADLPPNYIYQTPSFSNFLELLILYGIVALVLMGTPFILQGTVNFLRPRLRS
jgi:hypothetical protein